MISQEVIDEIIQVREERLKREREENKSTYEELLKKLEKNINNYCGDYGSLESRLEDTLRLILDILKELKGVDK